MEAAVLRQTRQGVESRSVRVSGFGCCRQSQLACVQRNAPRSRGGQRLALEFGRLAQNDLAS